jgi:hypothetical protein
MKCASDSTARIHIFFRDTIIKLIKTPNLEYKELTAQRAEPPAA